jgi:hypothetical protein
VIEHIGSLFLLLDDVDSDAMSDPFHATTQVSRSKS